MTSDVANLKINVEDAGLSTAADDMERLAVASERVAVALKDLGEQPNGGIRILINGDAVIVDVEPVAP